MSKRSARSCPLVSGVPGVDFWMLVGTPSLLNRMSGSLLVTDASVNPAAPESVSATVTVACTVISWWFGGQSRLGLTLHVTVGGVLSIRMVTVARFEVA